MRKPAFCICENKDADLISAFVFAIRIVQSLFYLNPKFQRSSHLLWLYSLVCVGPGRKPRRPVFSQRGSFKFNKCKFKTHSTLSKPNLFSGCQNNKVYKSIKQSPEPMLKIDRIQNQRTNGPVNAHLTLVAKLISLSTVSKIDPKILTVPR